MHNLLPSLNAPRLTRCAALLAAWWLVLLVSGVWGWGMGTDAPPVALRAFCASLAAKPAQKTSADLAVAAPVCKCAHCPGGDKCCCKSAHATASAKDAALLTARCDDTASHGPNAAPLAGGTWHAPVYFAGVPASVSPFFAARTGFFAPAFGRRIGRTPAPRRRPPLAFPLA